MSLSDSRVQLISAPSNIDVTSGLRQALLQNEQRKYAKQVAADQALKDYMPIAKSQTVSSVLTGINKDGGVQSGLETQQATKKFYEDNILKGLNEDYTNQVNNLDAQFKKGEGAYVTKYDANGNPISFDQTPEGQQYLKQKDMLAQKYEADKQALYGPNGQLSEILGNLKADPTTGDVLNRVTNPKDFQARVEQELLAKGVDPVTAKQQAALELQKYQAPALTERQKEQIKLEQQNLKALQELRTTIQTTNSTGNTTGTNGSGSGKGANGTTFERTLKSLEAYNKANGINGESTFSLGDTKVSSNQLAVQAMVSGGVSLPSVLEAMTTLRKGETGRLTKFDSYNAALGEIVKLAKARDAQTGRSPTGVGTKQSTQTTKRGYDAGTLKAIQQSEQRLQALLGGAKRKTVNQNLQDLLGIPLTDPTPKSQPKPTVTTPKGTAKPVKDVKSTGALSEALHTRKGGELARVIKSNDAPKLVEMLSSMGTKDVNRLSKYLDKNPKLLEALTAKLNKGFEPTAKSAEAPVAPKGKQVSVEKKSSVGKSVAKGYKKSAIKAREVINDPNASYYEKARAYTTLVNAGVKGLELKTLKGILGALPNQKDFTKGTKLDGALNGLKK